MIVCSYHNPVSKELYKLFVCEGFEPLSVGYHLLLPFFVLFAMYSNASAIWSKDKHMPTMTNINGIYIFNTAFPLTTAKENIKGAIRDAIKLIMNQIIICFFCIIFIFLFFYFYYFRYCHIRHRTITTHRNNYIRNI